MQRAVRSTMLSPRPGLIVAALLLAAPAFSWAAQMGTARPAAFARAERMREALEGRPEQQRTRLDYERVLDAYRAIYHGDPNSPKADASVAAVAELLAEEGRVFEDEKALHDAIGQYEFLRKEYPASQYRFSALLTEGEIDQRDLGDLERARAVYTNFLREYPQNPLAVEAKVELKTIRRQEMAGGRARPSPDFATTSPKPRAARRSGTAAPGASGEAGIGGNDYERTAPSSGRPSAGQSSGQMEESDLPAPGTEGAGASARASRGRSTSYEEPTDEDDDANLNAPPPPRRAGLPLVTEIRHWSAPNYTRVVISLEKVVQYQAARVPGAATGADRIFFDLYGTRLSPELMGRSVEVTGDGFLTRVRAAQPYSNLTRIVLDVNGVSDYSAFFLQGPPRLVIDVHGRAGGAPPLEIASNRNAPPFRSSLGGSRNANPARQNASGNLGANSPRQGDDSAGANGDDNDDSGALTDVTTLSRQPDQVRATKHPTTGPVVSSAKDNAASASAGALQRMPSRTNKPSAALRAADDVPPAETGVAGVTALPVTNQHLPNSMVRALGLKINRIVIDAGHGGHDSGTLGPGGLEEKDVVLDVALRLGRLLRQRLGADVIYTRSDDTFIPLETRTAIANQAQADLFISIHANSSPDTAARGVEVYYLNFTTSADALDVAARENASSDQSIHQLSDLVKKIALDDKINESREFAAEVDQSLYSGLEAGNPGLRDRGVKKAPFVVLIGANMPSILAEISFLTNQADAAELRDPAYRQRIAESLYRGVARYVSSLNGVRLAQVGSRASGTE